MPKLSFDALSVPKAHRLEKKCTPLIIPNSNLDHHVPLPSTKPK